MKNELKDGGPAFPVFPETGSGHAAAFTGMTLRDWFAGQALVGMFFANANLKMDKDVMALHAYDAADAMLKDRETALKLQRTLFKELKHK